MARGREAERGWEPGLDEKELTYTSHTKIRV